MRKYWLVLLSTFLATILNAQSGHWQGTVSVDSKPTKVEINLAQKDSSWSGDISFTDQKTSAVPLSKITVSGTSVAFSSAAVSKCTVAVSPDGKSMTGTVQLGPKRFPIQLARTSEATFAEPSKKSAITKEMLGTWEGTLTYGKTWGSMTPPEGETPVGATFGLHIRFTTEPDGSGLGQLSRMDEPGAEFPVDALVQRDKSVRFELFSAAASFEGLLAGDQIVGEWRQLGTDPLPLTLKRLPKKSETVSEKLGAGFLQERMLGPTEKHVYPVDMEEGTAVLGAVDQHGIDLVVDILGPDGKLVRSVDSPNGAEGPEPIDLTAFTAGTYKLILHGLDPQAKPGKYVIKIDRRLTVGENGERMAERNYTPAIRALWREYVKDPKAVERFVDGRKGLGPIIEEVDGDTSNVRVTYLYHGDESTDRVLVSAGPHDGAGGIQMQRFMQTPLFFASEIVPRDSRFRYGFVVTERRFTGPDKTIQVSEDQVKGDTLNPNEFTGLSVLTLPDALPQTYVVKNDSVPRGQSTPARLKSTFLNEDRGLSIYTPPGYDGTKPADLLIIFDGESYDGGSASSVPTPTILDNLIAGKKIGPTIAVFVYDTGKRQRDLGGYKPFADFVGKELIPWARDKYRINPGPRHVVAAGSSRGGVAASHCAFVHSEAIGNVLSQSGSYWIRSEGMHPPSPLTEDSGDLVLAFRTSAQLPIRFYMEVGRFEAPGLMLGTNRELRDVLMLKGYRLTYREFNSGHGYLSWRGSLADGLIALLSQEGN